MLRQFSGGEAGSRLFTYEVKGLVQNAEDKSGCPVRNSSSTFINVTYNRMNQEMQRIARLGGTIVAIKPYESASAEA